ncbi:MAG: hypothetical protein IJL80_00015 [Treponema sp.]|nr:hypothetical protein [Treponema sp.]
MLITEESCDECDFVPEASIASASAFAISSAAEADRAASWAESAEIEISCCIVVQEAIKDDNAARRLAAARLAAIDLITLFRFFIFFIV